VYRTQIQTTLIMGYGCQHQQCKVSAGMCCRCVCVCRCWM